MDIQRLAEKVDKVVCDFDPYDYDDNGYDVEQTKELIVKDPFHVIEMLADMLEELEV